MSENISDQNNHTSATDMNFFFCVPYKKYKRYEYKNNLRGYLKLSMLFCIIMELWNLYTQHRNLEIDSLRKIALIFRSVQILASCCMLLASYLNSFRLAYFGVLLYQINYIILFMFSVIFLFIFSVIASIMSKIEVFILLWSWVILYTMFSLHSCFVMHLFTRSLGKRNWANLDDIESANTGSNENEVQKAESVNHDEVTMANSTEATKRVEKKLAFPNYQEIKMVSLDL